MRVLIIGYSGFIGQSIARAALAQATTVYGLGRSRTSNDETGAIHIPGDRADVEHVKTVVREHKIDVVIDVIPMIAADTLPLLDCIDGSIDQYVMISSSDVYANYELLHLRAQGQPLLASADEDSPLRSTRFPYRGEETRVNDDPQKYLDAYDKLPLEAATQNLVSSWTILRLPMVYGPGDKQRRFRWAIEPMLRQRETLVIPRSWGQWTSTYGYVDNVGAAVVATLGVSKAHKQIFNIAEKAPMKQLAWAEKFARASNWQGQIELTDDPDHAFAKRLDGLDLNVPFKVNGSRFRAHLDFADVIDEATAIEQTIASEAVSLGQH